MSPECSDRNKRFSASNTPTNTDGRYSKPSLRTPISRLWWRLMSAPEMWIWIFRRLFKPRGTFQLSNNTQSDRYPGIFRFVQSQLGAENPVRILSFGCSTGEEVYSLRRYFPYADIKGIDINPGNIARCHARLRQEPEPNLSFAVAGSTRNELDVHYDAVFCMAVLRDGRLATSRATRCDPILYFDDFARAVADFRRCLKPGGLLVIRYSNFRLCDAPAGARFETLLKFSPPLPDKLPLFGRDNRLMPGVTYSDTVFQRLC